MYPSASIALRLAQQQLKAAPDLRVLRAILPDEETPESEFALNFARLVELYVSQGTELEMAFQRALLAATKLSSYDGFDIEAAGSMLEEAGWEHAPKFNEWWPTHVMGR